MTDSVTSGSTLSFTRIDLNSCSSAEFDLIATDGAHAYVSRKNHMVLGLQVIMMTACYNYLILIMEDFLHLLINIYAAHILSIRHLYYINCHNIFTNLVICLFLCFWRDYHSFCLHINTFNPQAARSGWQIFWNWIELKATLWLLGFKLRSSKRATSIPNQ